MMSVLANEDTMVFFLTTRAEADALEMPHLDFPLAIIDSRNGYEYNFPEELTVIAFKKQ